MAQCSHNQVMWILLVLWFNCCNNAESGNPDPTVLRREDVPISNTKVLDKCIEKFGGIELTYQLGTEQRYEFDLCTVVRCKQPRTMTSVIWICRFAAGTPVNYNSANRKKDTQQNCEHSFTDFDRRCVRSVGEPWVLLSSKPEELMFKGYPYSPNWVKDVQSASSITRILNTNQNNEGNPIVFILGGITENPFEMRGSECGVESKDHFYLIVATESLGEELKGLLKINLIKADVTSSKADKVMDSITSGGKRLDYRFQGDITQGPIETGYIQQNTWTRGLTQSAEKLNLTDCYLCTSARPKLVMAATAFETSERVGKQIIDLLCVLEVMSQENPKGSCEYWDKQYPVTPHRVIPPVFSVEHIMKVFCLSRDARISSDGITDMGQMDQKYCRHIVDLTKNPVATKLTVERADIWWYCGGQRLWSYLPGNWKGVCALISLVFPVQHFTLEDFKTITDSTHEGPKKKNIYSAEDARSLSVVYLDVVGSLRRVSNEYQLANSVSNDFESIFPWVLYNNDRLNYIHYEGQRLASTTRNGFEFTSEQFKTSTLIVYQNRVAIDMLLAEKEGICYMFENVCCIYIPNGAALKGTHTEALVKLRNTVNKFKKENADQ